jgi:hypothetical protein
MAANPQAVINAALSQATNPSAKLADSEVEIDINQSLMTAYEIMMDEWMGIDGAEATAEVAKLRTLINLTRAKLGFWRGEATFWRNEINENKTALKESNKLAQSG